MSAPDRLLAHPDYQRAIRAIAEREQDRRFCRHGLDHVTDVARLLWILVLENGRSFDKDTVLFTAMLHDIGRSVDNDNHAAESVRIARTLLAELGVPPAQSTQILSAIASHRDKNATIDPQQASLGQLLALADKKSRPCYRCPAAADCYWPETLKNKTITL